MLLELFPDRVDDCDTGREGECSSTSCTVLVIVAGAVSSSPRTRLLPSTSLKLQTNDIVEMQPMTQNGRMR